MDLCILSPPTTIIQHIKNLNQDRLSNQSSLFDNNNDISFDYVETKQWNKKELLLEEFKSLGFYISDHPLNEFKEIFNHLKIVQYQDFLLSNERESLVAGTIMSIQEKKSIKGTPFAIIKFSNNVGEFELFLFSEILINNRDKIKESESFILTLQKDRMSNRNSRERINVKKILSLDDMINKPYSKVTIELKPNYDIEEIKNLLNKEGPTSIRLIINNDSKKIFYNLENPRKFDFNHLKTLKSKEYVKKITI